MSNPLYTRLQATVQRLITKYGQAGNIRRIMPPDPVTGGESVPVDYPAKVFPSSYDTRTIDGTRIKDGDVQLYISSVGLAIIPTADDKVTVNGADYTIVVADPNIYDGITTVVHICQGRISP